MNIKITNKIDNTLINQLWEVSEKPIERAIRAFVLIVMAVGVLTISAKVAIPFYPVPLTLQTMVILLIGLTYGRNLGVVAVISYLLIGAMGAPVFAGTPEKGLGIIYMFGPTGGFLMGFVVATWVMAKFAHQQFDRNYGKTFLAMFLGEVIIFACGLLYMGALLGWDKPILAWGFTPFYLGEIVKIIAVTLMLPTVWKFINK